MILFGLLQKLIFAWRAALLVLSSWANFKTYFLKMTEGINPIGRVYFRKWNVHTGEVTFNGWIPNLIVAGGLAHIADQMSARDQAQISHYAVGFGTTAALSNQTALVDERFRDVLESVEQGTGGDSNKVIYTYTIAAGDATGPITESALFNSAAAGTMMCRSVFAVKNKEAGEAMAGLWEHTYSA